MKLSLIVPPLSIALALAACSKGPDDTAAKFVTAAYAGRTAEAMEQMDPSVVQMGGPKLMAMIGQQAKKAEGNGGLKEARSLQTKVEGDYATVQVEETFGDGSKKNESLKMRKVDGKWFVTM